MITWNYRVFREDNGDFIIREVFYDDAGAILGCTMNAVEPFGQTFEALATSIADMQAALEFPILTLADMPPSSIDNPTNPRGRTFSSAEIRDQLGLHTDIPTSKKAS